MIFSCSGEFENIDNEYKHEELNLTTDAVLENFSKSLAIVLAESIDIRNLIKNEASKKFNHDFDVLYILVKDIKLSNGRTLEDLLIQYIDINQLNYLTNNFPTPTIFVPTLPNNAFSNELWNTEDQIPDVAVLNYGGGNTYCYNSLGEEYYMERDEFPGFPIVVLKINERVNIKNNKGISVRSNSLEFDFVDPVFNNILNDMPSFYTPMTRVSSTDPKLQKTRDSYNIFVNNQEGWQRDYVYYSLTKVQDKGKFDLRYKEAIVGFQLLGNVDALLGKIADQTDDPSLISRYDWFEMRKKNPNQNPTTLTNWTEGELEFEVICQVVNKNLASSSIKTASRCAPEVLFDVNTIQSIKNRKTVYKITDITTQYKFLEVPLFEWDIENYGTSFILTISEFDQSETITFQNASTVEFATNFGFDSTFGEVVKTGLKFGISAKKTEQITNTIVKTLNSDDLGSVIINFGDELIISDQWIPTGLGWRGYTSRSDYNPKYKTAYYEVHIAQLYYGN